MKSLGQTVPRCRCITKTYTCAAPPPPPAGCRYEAEFFQQQLAMEADKATAMAQSRQLQASQSTLVCTCLYAQGKTWPLSTWQHVSIALVHQHCFAGTAALCSPQDELMKLQERLSALLASKEAEGPDARRSLGTLRGVGRN
jgi:hypothetical protein